MYNKIYIFLLLFGCYYIFSGYNEPFFIVTGIISSFLGLYVAVKMDVLKTPGMNMKILRYWLWLAKEIVVSSMQVLKHIWMPDLKFQPDFVYLKTTQEHEMGFAIYGNSITLTPGTVCVYIDDDSKIITAHSLTEEGRDELSSGNMDMRVKRAVS